MKGKPSIPKKSWHKTDDNKLLSLKNSGTSSREIAILMERTVGSVEARLHKVRYGKTAWNENYRKQWTPECDEQLKELANQKKGPKEIGQIIGRSRMTVAVRLAFLGISLYKKKPPVHLGKDPQALRLFIWENRIKPFLVLRDNGCMEWVGKVKTKDGYGKIGALRKKGVSVHRFSLETKLGRELNKNEESLHSCDNPSCANPDHLSAGSHQENMMDMIIKGRRKTKLTKEDVLSMRRKYNLGGITRAALAREFDVCFATASYVVTNKTWKHI